MAAWFVIVAAAAAAAGVSFALLLAPRHQAVPVTSVPVVSGVAQSATAQPAKVGSFVPCHHH
jgi:hypothetical protein